MALPNPYDSGTQISPNIQRVLQVDASGNPSAASAAASSAAAKTTVASSITSGPLLAANAARQGAVFTNRSSAILYLLLGAGTASATNYTVTLNGGDSFILKRGDYTGVVNGVWGSATGDVQVTETT